MKRTVIILSCSIFLSSCVTLLSSSHKNVRIFTTEPTKVIYNQDSINTINNKAILSVERKNQPLEITLLTDSASKSIVVKPLKSRTYFSNIFFNYGIGMLVDRKNSKRFSYPDKIYIVSSETTPKYYRFKQSNSNGKLYLNFSLPHINSFFLRPVDESSKVNTGFWGISGGFDYYYRKQQFLSLNASTVIAYFVPVPAPVKIIGIYETMDSQYISFANNYRKNRFTFGYGISIARNTWTIHNNNYLDPNLRSLVSKSTAALGFIFPTYFTVGPFLNVGLIYRPTFFRPNAATKFAYEHLISVDFAYKLRLLK
jgi:hypothetical protein